MDGTFERLNAALRERLRLRSGRDPLPSAGIADFQRLRPPGSAASRGDTTVTRRFGAGRGTCWWIRKGLMLKAKVHSAKVPDQDGLRLLLESARSGLSRISRLWLDAGYEGRGRR